jgi:hypothetical protein
MHPTFDQLEHVLSTPLQGLSVRQTQLRPTTHPEKWTIQQIVEHLLLTYTSTQHVMETRIAKGNPTKSKPSVPQRLIQLGVIRLGYFPKGRIAPSIVDPPSSTQALSGEQLIQTIHQQLSTTDQLFQQAEAAFGHQRAVTHHVLGPLNIHQWRGFHLIHGRHHARQIAAIRRQHHL